MNPGTMEESGIAPVAPPAGSVAAAQRAPYPKLPSTIEETGLTSEAVIDLLLKLLYTQGVRTGQEMIDYVRLPYAVVDPILMDLQQRLMLEVKGTAGHGRGGYKFSITPLGRERAREALETSRYVGPAPIPLELYAEWMDLQSVRHVRITKDIILSGFSDLVLNREIFEALGPPINSARSLFLYGAPGNGKTAIAERIAGMTGGGIFVPHAIDVDGQTVVLFDPVYHTPIPWEGSGISSDPVIKDLSGGYDPRFEYVARPTVFVGGELTLEQLDLQYDPVSKMYKAPFQLKAAGGVLILDDFGRQRVEPAELLNRWVVPLEKGIDFLTLHTGVKFPVPFDTRLMFATNLDPSDLVEEAFLRRIHYKIRVGNPSREGYADITRAVCEARGIPYVPQAVDHIYEKYYEGLGIEPRACHPRDIIDHIEDIARYHGVTAELTHDLLNRSCDTYFLVMESEALTRAQARYAIGGNKG